MGQSSASKLEERYFLQKVKLGEGAFGVVWRALATDKISQAFSNTSEEMDVPVQS